MLRYFLHIDENRIPHILLKLEGPKRNIYLDALAGFKKSAHEEALKFLIAEELKRLKLTPRQAEDRSFDQIPLKKENFEKIFFLLTATKSFFWKEKKIIFDPFTRLECIYHVLESPQEVMIDAIPNCDTFFAGNECIWVVKEGFLQKIPGDMEIKWIERASSSLISRAVWEEWKKELIEEKEWGIPTLKYVQKSSFIQEETPTLKLKDRFGCFVELISSSEKDLLAAGYVKKDDHYYCPMEKVIDALSLLMDGGWKIHFGEKKLVKRASFAFQVTPEKDITLSADYEKKSPFISLEEGSFTLLEKTDYNLMQEEWEKREGKLTLKKWHALQVLDKLPESIRENFSQKKMIPLTSFQGSLFPYQQLGVDWLSSLFHLNLGAILADEMGLGKTVQILAFLSTLTLNDPALIVVPTSLIFNWAAEISKFLPSTSFSIYSGKERSLIKAPLILTSYPILRQDSSLLSSLSFSLIVFDEAHMLKNAESQVALAAHHLKSSFKLMVTGTPVENRIQDLQSLLKIALPSLEITSKKEVAPFLLRRTKEKVGIELPEKIEQLVLIDMAPTQRTAYDSYKKGIKADSKGQFEILTRILKLRQICSHPALTTECQESAKMERLFSDLEELLLSGRKAIVYSSFTTLLHLLVKEASSKGWKYAYLDGETKDRKEEVRRFQEEEETALFFISLKAGGVGLNLTRADYVFLFDPWWNVAAENQAIARVHRIGRKDPVMIKRYIMTNSIEERMMLLKEKKQRLSDELFAEDESSLTEEDLHFLLN